MATNKDIIEKLQCVESRLTNGELEEMHGMIKEIKEDLKSFKNNVTKALWVVYSAVVGIIIKLMFWE